MTKVKEARRFALSRDEMIAALFLCNYGEVATDIINSERPFESEEEQKRFADHTETLLKHRGYWDNRRETHLVQGFESFIHLLMKVGKRVRCVRGSTVLMLHYVEGNQVIIQTCKGMDHTFELVDEVDKCLEALHTFYEAQETKEKPEQEAFVMEVAFFEMLHTITTEQLNVMIEQETYPDPILQFLKDFRTNNLVLDNISFLRTEYAVKNKSEVLEMQFVVESEDFVWYIHYQDMEKNREITVYPVERREYLGMVADGMNKWFK
ncbi:hypothetical protein NSQ26_13135 [Bacillus sp. FSL W7-1360]